ncbi:receptor-type tyrosine-protein phosphatase C isoform X2 [Varanus komodoensis]|uniref:receptor-type tyrosine-protein phosphatase C isoform X2 n=1 Tax=Varanus komodoensis TaxID=61221 RepID=UPI001CF7A6B3|nr:receptor-type tyrosine-protein phosphatase C isoform X2 [Varanus komodoensis]
MFLWLKVLVFALSLVNLGVFGKDTLLMSPTATASSQTIPPSRPSFTTPMDTNSSSIQAFSSPAALPSPSPSCTHATSDDLKKPSTHASISPTNSTPAAITPASANTTPVATSTKKCDKITISVKKYMSINNTVIAKVDSGSSNQLDIKCNGSCAYDSKSKHLTGLKECEHYHINITSESCRDKHYIHVPPVGRKLNYAKTESSVSLKWNVPDNFGCSLKYSYQCNDNLISGKISEPTQKWYSLSPNTDYTCKSVIIFNGATVITENVTFKTDYGKPNKPENVQLEVHATNISLTWVEPRNKSNGPIDGYMVEICNWKQQYHCELQNTSLFSHLWFNLNPYTKYCCSVWAYTVGNNKILAGERETKNVTTAPAPPKPVEGLKAHLTENANNAVRIICTKPKEINGPMEHFMLEWDGGSRNGSHCEFEVTDLYYLTRYTFKVTFFNGKFPSEIRSVTVDTRYNSKALIGFLAFLIVVTSLALLIVLYKIYILKREKARNADEDVVLVPRDDERNLKSIEPIPAELLWEEYKRKIADEGRLFLDEFQSIPRVFSKFSIKDARKPYNQNKNRYIDILPYDYNRVALSAIPGELGSDYINASYIDGYKEPRKYIAAQGPKDETTDDFWRMIWEQKATIVVMVTRCEEGNRVKCAKYWPSMEEETASYGDIIVKINECKVCPDYVIQKLHITNRREKTTERDVTHLQFTSWPDHGVPDNPNLLLKLRHRVNALSNFFSGPIVVHCSAGVGRTGTYIGIDAMLEGLESEGRVDVYGYVVKLRRQRCLMVQVEAQYILIHQALVEYLQFGETEVTIAELHRQLNHLKKRYPPSDPSLLEAEFQRLPSYKNWQSQKVGKRDENKQKNRSSTVIPYDYNRVMFKHEDEGNRESETDATGSSDEESDCDDEPNRYINASYIPGYWLHSAIIAAQGPLPETIGDFWSMVFQRKVKVIVMLTELKDDTQELCAQYWEEGQKRYDDFLVELKEVNCCSSYTVRTFQLTHVKRKETHEVFQYQYHKWKAFCPPENPKEIVNMIQNLKHKLPALDPTANAIKFTQNFPVVIHCRDGSEQTGVFCALMHLLESAETEGLIDVFQVVKSLRKARPGMVTSFEDYQFLYDAVASMYPSQNGELQKTQCPEHKVDIQNDIKKDEEAHSVASDLCIPVQETMNNKEMVDDSKPKDGSSQAESSSNGPSNPILTEVA